jgi:hypothetical protein
MTSITPTLAILASALKLEHLGDASMLRAADRSLEHLIADPLYEFDGSELRIISESDAAAGVWIITDGVGCSCKASKYPMCKHRALYRLLLAREILLDPLFVRTKIREQLEPIELEPEDRLPTFGTRVVELSEVYSDVDEWFQ